MSECIFCKIANKEIETNIIAENELAIAFLDTSPVSDGHTLIIPKKHFRNFSETPEEYLTAVSNLAKEVANKIKCSKLDPWGFNYLSNEESIAGQVIFHFHIHIIPKYGKDEGFKTDIGNVFVKPIKDILKILSK